ncbi:hypothetical protein GGX14DRAFT_643330, partial [Mycena pura]
MALKFVFFGPYVSTPGAQELRSRIRPAHVAAIGKLKEAGIMKFGGPFYNDGGTGEGTTDRQFGGSFLLLEAESHAAALKVIQADPYYVQGLWDIPSITLTQYEPVTRYPFVTANPAKAHDSDPPESKAVTPSNSRRTNYRMVGGILIPNEEGIRWFEQTYGRELSKDHSADASVRVELERVLTEVVEGVPFGVEYAPRRDAAWCDFLAVTQSESGVWEHSNPDGVNEVSLPGQQMKGGSAREEQMRGILCKLGLQPGEFKCYYL